MTIHNAGKKADRDRRRLLRMYDEMCKEFKVVKPIPTVDIAKMCNTDLNRVCCDLYNRQPAKKCNKFAQKQGTIPRRNPGSFYWFYYDYTKHYDGVFKFARLFSLPFAWARERRDIKNAERAKRRALTQDTSGSDTAVQQNPVNCTG